MDHHQYHSGGLARREMDIIKIQSQHDIPSGTWHWQYQGDLDAAVKRYVERFGEQPETVLVTETGLVAMPRQTQVIKISELIKEQE